MGRHGQDLSGSGWGVLAGICECIVSQHFKETEGSLSHSQVQATYPYPETDQISPCPILIPEDSS